MTKLSKTKVAQYDCIMLITNYELVLTIPIFDAFLKVVYLHIYDHLIKSVHSLRALIKLVRRWKRFEL